MDHTDSPKLVLWSIVLFGRLRRPNRRCSSELVMGEALTSSESCDSFRVPESFSLENVNQSLFGHHQINIRHLSPLRQQSAYLINTMMFSQLKEKPEMSQSPKELIARSLPRG
ncbi:hypothetical protein VTN31DRAFT_4816 [Thermomyces dupontii]|uniref:uncharacterized protein n=1 Tax=Talaromyces thermophilus TaxID=28565 RepID=UPI0037445025